MYSPESWSRDVATRSGNPSRLRSIARGLKRHSVPGFRLTAFEYRGRAGAEAGGVEAADVGAGGVEATGPHPTTSHRMVRSQIVGLCLECARIVTGSLNG